MDIAYLCMVHVRELVVRNCCYTPSHSKNNYRDRLAVYTRDGVAFNRGKRSRAHAVFCSSARINCNIDAVRGATIRVCAHTRVSQFNCKTDDVCKNQWSVAPPHLLKHNQSTRRRRRRHEGKHQRTHALW